MCKYDTSAQRIRIDFTKAGRRSFNKVNAKLGAAYIRFFLLERDLAEYIERHIDDGCDMLAEFDVRYDDGIMLTVYCSGGIFYIKEVAIVTAIPFRAIMLWQRVKRGWRTILQKVFVGWTPGCTVTC